MYKSDINTVIIIPIIMVSMSCCSRTYVQAYKIKNKNTPAVRSNILSKLIFASCVILRSRIAYTLLPGSFFSYESFAILLVLAYSYSSGRAAVCTCVGLCAF